jgi:hypothetical protein
MRSRHFLVGIMILTAIAGAGVAPASASRANSWIHDGYYASITKPTDGNSTPVGEFSVEFNVVGNGTKIEMGFPALGTGGVNCFASASLVAQDPNDFNTIGYTTINLTRVLAISPSGAFSYNGDVTVPSPKLTPTMTFTLPVSLSGHFIKGKIVPGKTTAVVGTFSAPGICAAGTPTRWPGQWDVSDK